MYILSLVSSPQSPKPLEFPKWIENGVFHHVNEVTFSMHLGYLRMELVARVFTVLTLCPLAPLHHHQHIIGASKILDK